MLFKDKVLLYKGNIMLIMAFIFFILGLSSVYFAFKKPDSTLTLIAKLIFYLAFIASFSLIILYIHSSALPVAESNSKMPL